MSSDKDSAEDSIIQGLEALLCGEDSEYSNTQPTRQLRPDQLTQNPSWKENSEFSRDSAFNFSSLSLRSRNPAFGNLEHSLESRISNQSFDPAFFAKPSVKNVSYDGCFVEGDSGIFTSHGKNTSFNQVLSEGHSVLSGAISHGGDLRAKSHSALGVQDAYNFTRYVVHLRRTWKKICTLNELWNGLQRKQDETCLPSELSLASLVICLTSLIIKIQKVLSAKLHPILKEIRNYLDLASSVARNGELNWKCLQHVSRIAGCLQILLKAEIQSQESKHSASQDFFRSEKSAEVWSQLALLP